MSILNVNQKKLDASLEARRAIAEYVLSGHMITVCPTKKVKVSRTVTGKEKIKMGFKAPINRPSLMYDNIVTK